MFVSENSRSKNFVNFKEKHPRGDAFFKNIAGYLSLTRDVLLGNL